MSLSTFRVALWDNSSDRLLTGYGGHVYIVPAGDSVNSDLPLSEDSNNPGTYFRNSVPGNYYDIYVDSDKSGSPVSGDLKVSNVRHNNPPDDLHGTDDVEDATVGASSLEANSVGPTQLQDEAVQEAKIGLNAVVANHLSTTGFYDPIQFEVAAYPPDPSLLHIKASGVRTNEIADESITVAKLAQETIDYIDSGAGSVTVDDVTIEFDINGDLAVKDLGISTAKLADSAVTSVKIGSEAVQNAALGLDAVQAGNINPSQTFEPLQFERSGAPALFRLTAGAVGNSELAAGAVTNAKVSDVSGAKIANQSLVPGKISLAAQHNVIFSDEFGQGTEGLIGANNISDGAVTTAKILDDTVEAGDISPTATFDTAQFERSGAPSLYKIKAGGIGESELASAAVTGDKVASTAISNSKIVDGAVSGAKIASLAVDASKLAISTEHHVFIGDEFGGATTGLIGTNNLSDDSVTNAKLASGAVDTLELADDAVTSAKIAPSAIGPTELANGAVDTAKIAADAVDNTKIAPSAVGNTEIADSAVGNSKISDVSGGKLLDQTVTPGKVSFAAQYNVVFSDEFGQGTEGKVGTNSIADNAITAAKIASGAVGSTALGNNSVGTSELQDDSVTNLKIVPLAVDTAELADDAVTSAKIAAGAVDTTALGTDAVTEPKIAANAVGTTQLLNGAVTLAKMAADSVDASKIASGAVGTSELAAGAVTNTEIASGTIAQDRLSQAVQDDLTMWQHVFDNTEVKVMSMAIRQDTQAGGWYAISSTGTDHLPTSGFTVSNDLSGAVKIDYTTLAPDKITNFMVTPDESLAGKGFFVGTSYNSTRALVQLYKRVIITGRVYGIGTDLLYTLDSGVDDYVTIDDTNFDTNFGSSGEIKLGFSGLISDPGRQYSATASPRGGGDYLPSIRIDSTNNDVEMFVTDYTGNLITSASSSVDFNFYADLGVCQIDADLVYAGNSNLFVHALFFKAQ